MDGTPDDDYLLGTAAAESINGKGGEDTLEGGPGNDTLNGGDGFEDWVSYRHAAAGVVVQITSSPQSGAEGTDTLIHVENLIGSEFDDTLIGGSGSNRLEGLGGHNVLNGSYANDWASYVLAPSAVNASLVLSGGYQNVVGTQFDWYIAIENLQGSAFDDTLRGDAHNNELSGGAGADTLIGGPGGDLLDGGTGADSMVGGPGSDGYYVDDPNDIVVEQADGGGDYIHSTIDFALPVNVEHLWLENGYGDLNGSGNSGDNELRGNDGFNVLRGKGGDDTLQGTLSVEAHGVDTLIGGPGNDLYRLYGSSIDVVREAMDGGNDTIEAFLSVTVSSMTVPPNVEWVHITPAGDGMTVLGNSQDNGISAVNSIDPEVGMSGTVLRGRGGNDTLVAGGLDSVLWGGEGDDFLTYAGWFNTALHGGPGNDTIEGWFVYFDVAPGAENADTLGRWQQLRLDDDIFTVFSAGEHGVEAGNVVVGAGHTALDADDYLLVDTSDAGTWSVWYDADGNGTDAAPEVFAYGYYHDDPDDNYHQPTGHDAFRVVG